MTLPASTDRAVVIGAGVVGLCSAWYLAERGWEVTVLDNRPEGADRTSSGNAGVIVPSHFTPLAAPGMISLGIKMALNPGSPFGFRIPPSPGQVAWMLRFLRSANARHVARSSALLRDLNLASRQLYRELAGRFEFGLQSRGLLMLCQTQKALDEEAEMVHAAHSLGLDAAVLDREAVRQLEPGIQIEAVGAVHFRDDAHLSPSAFLTGLRQALLDRGVAIRTGISAEGFERGPSGLMAVRASGESFPCSRAVLAAGAFSGDLARQAGLQLPLMPGRGMSMTLPSPAVQPATACMLVEPRVAITPMPEGLRIAGTMEIGAWEEKPNLRRLEGVRKAVGRYFPQLASVDLSSLQVWTGLRPCSADGLPFLGHAKDLPGLVVATGHSMLGVSLGPISGLLVAQLCSQQATELPVDAMNPSRFSR